MFRLFFNHYLPGDSKWRCCNTWYIKVLSNKPTLTSKEVKNNGICPSASSQASMHLYNSILLLTLRETSPTAYLKLE